MKTKEELQPLVELIASPASPVGMDAVYVHALILDKLESIERRLRDVEIRLNSASDSCHTG